MDIQNHRTYLRENCVTFLKTAEVFGGLSNMAGGYPLRINNISILTSEALYQACRFPHLPEIQKVIIGQRSPMSAKMISKPYRKDSRSDWDNVRVRIMYWCLRVKLAQNWEKFSDLLRATEDKPIVEESRRDQFWGAKPVDAEILVGENMLGRLLMKLRDQLRDSEKNNLLIVNPPVSNFLFMNVPIGVVEGKKTIVECIPLDSQPSNTMPHNMPLPIVENISEEPITKPVPSIEASENHHSSLKQAQLF